MSSFVTPRNRRTRTAIYGLVLVLTLGLTGCSNPLQNVLERMQDGQASQAEDSGGSAEVEPSGNFITREVPANFPKSIPLPSIPLFNGVHSDVDGAEGWLLQYHGSFDDTTVDEVSAKMVESGFTQDESGGVTGVITLTMLSNADYIVTVSLMGSKDEQVLQIMVAVRSD